MGRRPPFRRGQAVLRPAGPGLFQRTQPGRPGGPLADLVVQGAALELGGRHLGGQARLLLIRVREGQQVRVEGRWGPGRGLLRPLLRGRGRGELRAVVDPDLPGDLAVRGRPPIGGTDRPRPRPSEQPPCLGTRQDRQEQPVPEGPRPRHRLRRRRDAPRRRQLPDPLLRVAHRPHQDQLLLGTGHPHVQDPLFLRQGLPAQTLLHGGPGQGRPADPPSQIHVPGAQAHLRVHQHRRVQIPPGEGTVQIRQDHHREL